ncbi:universal stress protein [Arthrobacter deserti]|uniref:Universal stress protein n=1 Tax=Arthrobacter deserti TaxID=1742687 RepID=A0ABX1JUR0_9MICC|nr:universal stress protein [Arthrobacter deserti]
MTVVVGFTDTPEGLAAARAATAEAALRRTGVVLLDSSSGVRVEELSPVLAEAARTGVGTEVQPLPPETDLGDALIDASYRPDVDLVVIGVRRRSPVGKLFLGSTSQRVILEAGCAVQAVKVRVGPRG